MKKILLCIILACCNILLMQAENKQYLGLQVGFTHPLTRLNAPTVGQEKALQTTAYNGLKVGFVYDATIVKGFGYTIGLNYTFGANATDWMKDKQDKRFLLRLSLYVFIISKYFSILIIIPLPLLPA